MSEQIKSSLEISKRKSNIGLRNGVEKFYTHNLTIMVGGIEVAKVLFYHYLKPFNFLYITNIRVKDEYKNKGIGRGIILKINEFVKKRKTVAILDDDIAGNGNNPGAIGFYHRHGWSVLYEKGNPNVLGYNLEKLSEEDRKGLYYSIHTKDF